MRDNENFMSDVPQFPVENKKLCTISTSLCLLRQKLIKYDESKLKAFCEKVKTCKTKDKNKSENSVTATYMSCKKVKYCSSQEFASDLLVNLKALRGSTQRE